jgi:hypothetical protein
LRQCRASPEDSTRPERHSLHRRALGVVSDRTTLASADGCLIPVMTRPQSRRIRFALLIILAASSSARGAATIQQTDCSRPIAHVSHGDVSFTVSIDPNDNRLLALRIPERQPGEPRLVRIELRLRDESVIEGVAERQPSIASGGFVDWRYRFDAKRPLTIPVIFSVTISVADQTFEVFPW